MVMTTGATAGVVDKRATADAGALCCAAQASKQCNRALLSVLRALHCCQSVMSGFVLELLMIWAVATVDIALVAIKNIAMKGFMGDDASGYLSLGCLAWQCMLTTVECKQCDTLNCAVWFSQIAFLNPDGVRLKTLDLFHE